MKWAFTYKIHRHVHDFVGPFDSHKKMMEAIASLAIDDDTNMGDLISDYTRLESVEETMAAVGLRVYRVEEETFDSQEVFDMWKWEIAKYEEKWKRISKEQQDKHDRAEYERLKKKFE
jgi:hypothetical protein